MGYSTVVVVEICSFFDHSHFPQYTTNGNPVAAAEVLDREGECIGRGARSEAPQACADEVGCGQGDSCPGLDKNCKLLAEKGYVWCISLFCTVLFGIS